MTKEQAVSISLAQWSMNMSHSFLALEDWCAHVGEALQRCSHEGADILTLPEYVTEGWLSRCPVNVPDSGEVAWMAGEAVKAIPILQEMVNKSGVALQAGTMPWPDTRRPEGAFVNRAWMLFPDRDPVHYDKVVLTPFEQEPHSWMLQTGDTLPVFKWRGVNMAMVICLDVEMPALSARMATLDIDLLLVPSMTHRAAGYYRVFNCARARAVELMTVVAVTGCVGVASREGETGPRVGTFGGASVYFPSEEELGHTGIFAEIPGRDNHHAEGRILWAKDIPITAVRKLRHGDAEVWPGAWQAGHIQLKSGQ